MDTFALTLTADTQYVDHSFETASWYDKYTLKAGTYALVPRTSPGTLRYTLTVDAVLTESYRVNRVFGASSAEHTVGEELTTVTLSFYGYEVKDGAQVYVGREKQSIFAVEAVPA